VLLFLLGSSIAVAAGMGLTGVLLNNIYSSMPMSRIVGELTWSTTSNFILTAIPFYILFGEILLRSGTAERMYAALVQWFSWLPGGLMHSNIGACALFGSVSARAWRRPPRSAWWRWARSTSTSTTSRCSSARWRPAARSAS
jgi:TRAP-type mannitol/chloroaromatic compound transport system permease large subunit